jgi:hypothetical protein
VRPRATIEKRFTIIDSSIAANQRDDGLYHAYNLIDISGGEVGVDHLYPMLEGQVAALSAGTIAPADVVRVVEALFRSEMYRPDQRSFTLYPDRELPGFLAKNRFEAERAKAIPLLGKLLAAGDDSVVYQDADGWCRFNADLINVDSLRTALGKLGDKYAEEAETSRAAVEALYEDVFRHRAFTGRSGTMFGYEGLGSIYWHMVSKLLLAVQENYFAALKQGADAAVSARLAELYYQVREGLGFNKTPLEYGAFPTDPYSHVGASQPGMTGQVKEEVLSRFGELGVRVSDGAVSFQPSLLRQREFLPDVREFRYLDVDGDWQTETVPESALAFTWCQAPVIYRLSNEAGATTLITWDDGREQELPQLSLPHDIATELFRRSGRIRKLTVSFDAKLLLDLQR